ncbi:hypothetical protein KC851_03130 [Candidatus Kaiserbacteria bacterium]|nr:hypothetical protein [Candidatus Kaiserbacteria bacterium]
MEGIPKQAFREEGGGLKREKTGKLVERVDEETGETVLTPEHVAYDEERLLAGANDLNETQRADLKAYLDQMLGKSIDGKKKD